MLSARIQRDIRWAYQQTRAVGIVGIAQLDSHQMLTRKAVVLQMPWKLSKAFPTKDFQASIARLQDGGLDMLGMALGHSSDDNNRWRGEPSHHSQR